MYAISFLPAPAGFKSPPCSTQVNKKSDYIKYRFIHDISNLLCRVITLGMIWLVLIDVAVGNKIIPKQIINLINLYLYAPHFSQLRILLWPNLSFLVYSYFLEIYWTMEEGQWLYVIPPPLYLRGIQNIYDLFLSLFWCSNNERKRRIMFKSHTTERNVHRIYLNEYSCENRWGI